MTETKLATTDDISGERSASMKVTPAGNWVVVGMFAFAIVMIGLLWAYWEFYTRPFRPLQYAIAEAYPGSSPRVIGGRHKSHKEGNPNVLRIIVWIPSDDGRDNTTEDFDPVLNTDLSEARALDLARIARDSFPIDAYEVMDIHLIQRVPESDPNKWSASHTIAEWKQLLDAPAS